MLRSILAVLAGYVVMVAIVVAATYALQQIEPGWFLIGAPLTAGYLAVNIAYSLLAALTGGYLVARLAKQAHLKHVYALATLSLAMAVLSAFASGGDQPVWYRIFLAVMMPMVVIAGGRLRVRPMQPA